MTASKPTTRTEAAKPKETEHLTEEQRQALDLAAQVEHTDGPQREKLNEQIQKKDAQSDL